MIQGIETIFHAVAEALKNLANEDDIRTLKVHKIRNVIYLADTQDDEFASSRGGSSSSTTKCC